MAVVDRNIGGRFMAGDFCYYHFYYSEHPPPNLAVWSTWEWNRYSAWHLRSDTRDRADGQSAACRYITRAAAQKIQPCFCANYNSCYDPFDTGSWYGRSGSAQRFHLPSGKGDRKWCLNRSVSIPQPCFWISFPALLKQWRTISFLSELPFLNKNHVVTITAYSAVCLIFIFLIVSSIIKWRKFTYRIEEDELRIEEGLLTKKKGTFQSSVFKQSIQARASSSKYSSLSNFRSKRQEAEKKLK